MGSLGFSVATPSWYHYLEHLPEEFEAPLHPHCISNSPALSLWIKPEALHMPGQCSTIESDHNSINFILNLFAIIFPKPWLLGNKPYYSIILSIDISVLIIKINRYSGLRRQFSQSNARLANMRTWASSSEPTEKTREAGTGDSLRLADSPGYPHLTSSGTGREPVSKRRCLILEAWHPSLLSSLYTQMNT